MSTNTEEQENSNPGPGQTAMTPENFLVMFQKMMEATSSNVVKNAVENLHTGPSCSGVPGNFQVCLQNFDPEVDNIDDWFLEIEEAQKRFGWDEWEAVVRSAHHLQVESRNFEIDGKMNNRARYTEVITADFTTSDDEDDLKEYFSGDSQANFEDSDEATRLFLYHLSRQGIEFTKISTGRGQFEIPKNVRLYKTAARKFGQSPKRLWVQERAKQVELNSLNMELLQTLFSELLQRPGENWEKVLTIFFFGSDICTRVLEEISARNFSRLLFWILAYVSTRLTVWAVQEGGWEVVLRYWVEVVPRNVNARPREMRMLPRNLPIGLFCLSAIVVSTYLYIKYR